MFHNRIQVGKLLANQLEKLQINDPVVLAIPRGGVVVAREIALALNSSLDLVVTRKIGAPGEPEYAIGAVTQDGEPLVDKEVVRMLGISEKYVEEESARQTLEIRERMHKYRGDRSYPDLGGKNVVIVDDGIATGNTALAAIKSVRRKRPSRVILAVGVAPQETVDKLSKAADEVICLATPEPFYAVGEFYEEFEQVGDEEVKGILDETNSKQILAE
jgi:putative phosphoribosyl transferase